MKIINKSKNTILAEDVVIADNPFTRMKGLLGRKELKKGQALILKPCNSIHTFFMLFSIDAIFVGLNNQIIKTSPFLKPWRLTRVYLSAKFCIELPAGTIDSSLTSEGDFLSFKE